MKILKYPYSKPDLTKDDTNEVLKALKSQYLTQGAIVKKFEGEIKKKFKVKEAVICNSGTAALHSVYRSIGLDKSNGIITTPITFLATANAARMCNAPLHFADVDPISGLITPQTLEQAFQRVKFKVRVVTVVHLGGNLCNLKGLHKIAKKHGSFLVEDACHALGANYSSSKTKFYPIGSCKYSIASTFSFHAIKNITMGEGGCITTNNFKLSQKIRLNISHGMIRDKAKMINPPKKASWYYQMQDIGWNYRASEISCALGLSQFKRINQIISKRVKIAKFYKKYIKKNKYINYPEMTHSSNKLGWHLFQLLIDFRKLGTTKENFIQYMKKKSIGTQVHYIPLILQPYYKNLHFKDCYIGALSFYEKTISIPMYTSLTENDVKYISEEINRYFNK